jgi:putative hydrolase of the HAD superfamily
MIRNIVFDMGQVLTAFDPDYFIRQYVTDPEDICLIRSEAFEKSEWVELDRGTVTEEDMIAPICARLPVRLHAPTKELLLNWHEHMTGLDNILPTVLELKEKGYSLFLLSNAGKAMLNFTDKIPALQYFSGILFSAEVLLLKPDKEIYLKFFERFLLKPQECYFIDDRAENIGAGRSLGMDGFCYQGNVELMRDALKQAGVALD